MMVVDKGREQKPAFLIDLDDTLIVCGKYYEEVRQRFYDYMEGLGFPRGECINKFTGIELHGVRDSRLDFKHIFPSNMINCYKNWCAELKKTTDPTIEKGIMEIGYSVYNSPFEAMADAHNMLYELSHDYELFLYTKGNQDIQVRKILKADLDSYFSGVWITNRKSLKNLVIFMLRAQLQTRTTWVLGNSPRSDILPALELGIPVHQTILIESYQWEEDFSNLPMAVHKVKALAEVVPLTRQIIVEGTVG